MRGAEAAVGLKAPDRGSFVKKVKKSQPPVEAPYVPPRIQKPTKSLDKTIDIFEGMTLVELAKRTGKLVPTLQNILVNVGEKVDSEFDSLSIDVVELIAMVFSSCSSRNILY